MSTTDIIHLRRNSFPIVYLWDTINYTDNPFDNIVDVGKITR